MINAETLIAVFVILVILAVYPLGIIVLLGILVILKYVFHVDLNIGGD